MGPARLDQTVESYGLFGEVGDLPDVVHCETIQARSELHGWELAPHRHARLHQVLLVSSGGGYAALDGRQRDLVDMTVVNVPSGHIHGFKFVEGTNGWVVTLASEMIQESLRQSADLQPLLAQTGVVQATPEMARVVGEIFSEHSTREFGRAHMLRSLSALLLGHVARSLLADGVGPDTTIADDRFEQFQELLEAHFVDHWTVSRYAQTVGVSRTHLSRLTRAATGEAPSRLIDHRLVLEARRNLAYTNLPVSSIAASLGFGDPAYFSRVFARVTSMSPTQFRQHVDRSSSVRTDR